MLDNRQQLLKEFPVLDELIYFNTASIGIAPDSTINAIDDFLRRYQDRSIYDDTRSFAIIESARDRIARLLNASSQEIAFMPNTSYGVNTLARGIRFRSGDEIIIPRGEFPSNVLPWQAQEKARIVMIEPKRPLIDEIAKAINIKTRTIAISAVAFTDGYAPDLAAISELCHKNDIILAVDAIQAIGNYPIDVAELGIDMMASGGQKWQLTPWGSGFLYVSQEFIQKLDVHYDGWLSRFQERKFGDLLRYDLPYPDNAERFECGSPVFPSIAGYDNSLRILLDIGIENIFRHSIEIADYFIEKARSMGNWQIISDTGKNRSAIVSVTMPNAHGLYEYLRSRDVVPSFREGAIRFAFHIYNTISDIDRLFDVVRDFEKGHC